MFSDKNDKGQTNKVKKDFWKSFEMADIVQ